MRFVRSPLLIGFAVWGMLSGAVSQNISITESHAPPDSSAVLDIQPDINFHKGLLPPRLSTPQRNALQSPATGLLVYDSTTNRYNYWNGVAWMELFSDTLSATNPAGQNADGGVAINTKGSRPHHSALLDISDTTGGLLLPRMTASHRNSIVSPATGLLIYNIGTDRFNYYTGSQWESLCGASISTTTGGAQTSQGLLLDNTGGGFDSSAIVQMNDTTRGFLMPRLTTSQRNAILSPAPGLTIYNRSTDQFNTYTGGSQWITLHRNARLFPPAVQAATNSTDTGIVANWSEVPGAIYTHLWIDDNNDFSSPLSGYGPKTGLLDTTDTVTTLTCNTTYYYRVQALNNCGMSGFSDTIAVTTSSCCVVDSWTARANFGGTARYGATGFSIDSLGYLGIGYDGSRKQDFWEYNPNTDTWTQKADFGGGIRNESVGFSIDTLGYIGTGKDNSGPETTDFWAYDPGTNTWSAKKDFGGSERYSAVGFSIGSKGYIGTGKNSSGTYYDDFWEYDSGTDTWIQKADFKGTPRHAATGLSIDTLGYIGLGYDGSNRKDFWEYDPDLNSWTSKSNFPGSVRRQTAEFSVCHKGYVGTGYDGASYLQDFWEYDPRTDTWIQRANFGGGIRSHAVGLAIDNTGYIGTGYDGSGHQDFWSYCPDC